MDEPSVRIKLSVGSTELEVEGPESFVKPYADKVGAALEAILAQAPAAAVAEAPGVGAPATADTEVPASFGECYGRVARDALQRDKILAAAYWVQSNSAHGAFATQEASELLREQGVKLGNASDCVKQNVREGRTFKHGKGTYRLTETGAEEARKLLGLTS